MTSMLENSTSLIFCFDLLLYLYCTGVGQIFNLNILANSKPNSKTFQDINQGPMWLQLMKKSKIENLMPLSL
jgi:hypothetical protein